MTLVRGAVVEELVGALVVGCCDTVVGLRGGSVGRHW